MRQDHLISNRTYDNLKRIVTVVLPAFATFYAAIAVVWGLPGSEEVVATCAAFATFCGVLLNVSTKSWNNSESKYDGKMSIVGFDEDTGNPDLSLTITTDPVELFNKRTIRLRATNETE